MKMAIGGDSTCNLTDAIVAYLEEKGVGIPEEELEAFASYLSDEYVLIIAWIASRGELLAVVVRLGR